MYMYILLPWTHGKFNVCTPIYSSTPAPYNNYFKLSMPKIIQIDTIGSIDYTHSSVYWRYLPLTLEVQSLVVDGVSDHLPELLCDSVHHVACGQL